MSGSVNNRIWILTRSSIVLGLLLMLAILAVVKTDRKSNIERENRYGFIAGRNFDGAEDEEGEGDDVMGEAEEEGGDGEEGKGDEGEDGGEGEEDEFDGNDTDIITTAGDDSNEKRRRCGRQARWVKCGKPCPQVCNTRTPACKAGCVKGCRCYPTFVFRNNRKRDCVLRRNCPRRGGR